MPLTPIGSAPTTGTTPDPEEYRGGLRRLGSGGGMTTPSPIPDSDEEGLSLPAVLGGGAILAGAGALATKLPGKMGKVAKGVNALRQQLMLSGLALPKSLLGNAGAAVNASIEGGSLKPLKALLSGQTLKDAATAFSTNKGLAQSGQAVNLPKALSMPGRLMGAMDEATQAALKRGGLSAEQAANETLQTPLQKNFGPMGHVLESPMASYLHPFRRTPFNQFIEGLKLYDPSKMTAGSKRLLGTHSALGAVHGAATSDDNLPVSVPLAVAAAGRGGLPYGVAALVARALADGEGGGGGITGSMLPVSEYGYEQALQNPLRPFEKPAALSAWEKVMGK